MAAAVATVSIAAAGPVALAVQNAIAAPEQRSAPTTKGLLDPILPILTGLVDTLKGLLGTSTLASLDSLTAALNGGGDASTSALAPVTSLLQGLAAGDPTNADVLNQVAALTGSSSGGQLATPFLAPVDATVAQLAGLSGLTTSQATALTNLHTALGAVIAGAQPTDAVAGLPLASLPLDPAQLLALGDLLSSLQGGTASSPALLSPVTDLLHSVSLTSGLPAPVAQVVDSVSSRLRDAPSLDSGLLKDVGQLLNAIAATPGVPSQAATLLTSLSGLLGSPGHPTTTTPTTTTPTTTTPTTTTPTTTTPHTTTPTTPASTTPRTTAPAAAKTPAQLKRVKYDRKRGSLVLTLACPTGKVLCGSIVYALAGTRSVVKPSVVILRDGQVVDRRMHVDARTRKALKRNAVRLTIYAVTSKTQIASKALKIAKTNAARKK